MFSIDFTFIFAAINLFLLYLFVNKFLFKRLGGFMEARSESIAADIEKGRELKAEGEEYRLKYEQILSEGAEEGKRIVAEARDRAEKEYAEILARAKKEAEWILSKAKEEGQLRQEKIAEGLKADVAELSIIVASKIIEANMDNAANREMVRKFLDKEAAA